MRRLRQDRRSPAATPLRNSCCKKTLASGSLNALSIKAVVISNSTSQAAHPKLPIQSSTSLAPHPKLLRISHKVCLRFQVVQREHKSRNWASRNRTISHSTLVSAIKLLYVYSMENKQIFPLGLHTHRNIYINFIFLIRNNFTSIKLPMWKTIKN